MNAPTTPELAWPSLRFAADSLVRYFVYEHAYAPGEHRPAAWAELSPHWPFGWSGATDVRETCYRLGATLHVLDLHAVRAAEARDRLGTIAADVVVVNHGRGDGVMRAVAHEHFGTRAEYVLLGEGPVDGRTPGTSVFVRRAFGVQLEAALAAQRPPFGAPRPPQPDTDGGFRWGWAALMVLLIVLGVVWWRAGCG